MAIVNLNLLIKHVNTGKIFVSPNPSSITRLWACFL